MNIRHSPRRCAIPELVFLAWCCCQPLPRVAAQDGLSTPKDATQLQAPDVLEHECQAAEPRGPLSTRIDETIANHYFGPDVPLAGDFEFHRRIYLDLLGRGPSIEESEAFVRQLKSGCESNEGLRNRVIDDLLEREEFSRYYAKVLEVMFTERRELISVIEFRSWIGQWIRQHRPLNELCTEILAADGGGGEIRPAASFILNRQAEPHLVTRDVGRIFFGRDLQCAQCHDHPLVPDYEQAHYYGILSFVHRTYLFQDEKRGNLPFLGEKGDGDLEFVSVFQPDVGKTAAQPVLPTAMAMDSEPDFVNASDAYVVAPEKDKRGIPRFSRRQQLAVLATHPENECFNRNLANRLWANMMGVGVVDPVDMHHSANPPVSAALLRLLADELVSCQYNLRDFLRQIARSKAYQRSVMLPDLSQWTGPPGGLHALNQELVRLDTKVQQLAPHMERGQFELEQAESRLRKSQEDVNRLQQQCADAKQVLQRFIEERDKEVARLAELKEKQTKQRQLIDSLQGAMNEAEKVWQLTPDDQELAAWRTLLGTRLAKANADQPTLENDIQAQQETVDDANHRVEDQHSRILALANRRLALGDFVAEARGLQRRALKQIQALVDCQADCGQQKLRIETLRKWLELRDQLQQVRSSDDLRAASELQARLDLQQAELFESWHRSYGIRRIRGLSPEQMAGATYIALELDQPVRAKALADWETSHQNNPVEQADSEKRQVFVNAAVADNMWNTVEDLIVTRFSAPAGAPQDGFFATVDQALMIQNDPTFQSWLKVGDGTLIPRLAAIEDPQRLADQLYLGILGRLPEADEVRRVGELLSENAAERAAIVQELAWGLLASTEFRFSM